MGKIPLQQGIIYGPVSSRRLGSSLGINLTPSAKICSFSCVYCQYGPTPAKLAKLPFDICGLPSPEEVGQALTERLKFGAKYDYITFSGNGEPTLHPQFEVIVKIVKLLKDKYAPQSKLAILSNASTLERENVQRALTELDMRIMKLDAGDEEIFQKINQPHPSIRFENLIRSLKETKGITIQTMFVEGESMNSSEEHLRSWRARIKETKPEEVQIYSLARPAWGKVKKVPKTKLEEIANQLREEGIQARAY